MEIYQLIYLKAIVEHRSYSKAASSLFVTQPTLSTAIKKLETELNVTMLKRESKEIHLTEIGERLYPRCVRILDEYQQIFDTANAYNNISRPPLKVIVPYFLNKRFILLSKTLFPELMPNVSFSIATSGILSSNEYIEKGTFDILISSERLLLPNDDSYYTQFYRKIEYFLYMPKKHPLAQYREIRPDMLKGERILAASSDKGLGLFFKEYFDQFEMSDILRGDNQTPDVLVHLVDNGLGLALLPKQELLPERITYRPLAPNLEDSLMFVYPKTLRQNEDVMQTIRILLDLNAKQTP